MTLRTKIFSGYTLFLLLPLLAVLGTREYLNIQHEHQRFNNSAHLAVNGIIHSMRSAAYASLAQSLRTSSTDGLQEILSLYDKSEAGSLTPQEAQAQALQTLLAQQKKSTIKLLCIDQQGMLLAHPNTARVDKPINDLLNQHLRNTPRGALVHFTEAGQQPTFFTPVEFAPWKWTVAAFCPINALPELVSLDTLTASLSTFIAESFSADLFVLREQNEEISPTSFANPLAFSPQQLRRIGQTIRLQHQGTMIWNPGEREEERALFFAPLPELKLIVGIAVPGFKVRSPLKWFWNHGGMLLILLSFLTVGASLLLAHRLSRPLHHLASQLAQPENYLLEQKYPQNSSEECRRIISSCHQMLGALHSQQQMLALEQENSESIHQQLQKDLDICHQIKQTLANENTTLHNAEKYLRLFKNIFDNASEAIYITDPGGRILTTNHSFSRITGYMASEIIGHQPTIFASSSQTENLFTAIWKTVPKNRFWSGEAWIRKKNGSISPQWISVSVIYNEHQKISHYFSIFHDITELKRKEKQISILAYRDALTKLPNRAALEQRLTKAISRAGREQRSLAVFFIDLDNFKNINDSLGHDKGDRVLVEVAERLSATIRSEDTLSRLGGDEFILLSESVEDENAVYNLANRILAALKQPIKLPPNTVNINASIGIALFPDDGHTSLELIKNADMAMYKAKKEGKNKFVLFTQEMNDKLVNRIRIENAIRGGLKRREFTVFYQPKINLNSEQTTSFEALVRWRKGNTLLTADQFIPVAEESGLIDEMSLYVLDEVCIFFSKIKEHQLTCLPISVNMSQRTFNQNNLAETIDTLLDSHSINHQLIEFEVSEATAMKNVQHSLDIMHRFGERGIRFSIDDFGTGYSSLSYLRELPVSTLKIDKRFINETDKKSRSIVSTITAMSKQMELNVVAEGVETNDQITWLRRIGCNEAQGYYFSKPMTETDTLEYIHLLQKRDRETFVGYPGPAL